jgi:hypothetical protein
VPQAGTLSTGQQGAIDKVISNSNGQPNYNPAINSGTMGLLNGGGAQANDSADHRTSRQLKNGILGQTASGANIGNNPALKAQIDQITTDATNQTNGAWAAAGRDGSPGNAQALGRGIASGVAPVLAQQYNTDVNNALNAATSLYGAGNTTYGLLNGNQNQANRISPTASVRFRPASTRRTRRRRRRSTRWRSSSTSRRRSCKPCSAWSRRSRRSSARRTASPPAKTR